MWAYLCSQVNQNLEKICQQEGNTHQSYKHIAPVYAIAIVDSNYFSDDLAFHSFSMREDTTGEVLTITNNGQENHLVKMAFLELKKYKENLNNDYKKIRWLEFFGNKQYTNEPDDILIQADNLLNLRNWSKEEKLMYDEVTRQQDHYWASLIYAQEEAQAKGLAQGIAQGIEQGIEQGFSEGSYQTKRETAVAFKRLGIDIAKIAEGTGLSVEEIEKL